MPQPWDICACGHPMLMHDVEDMNGTNPMCCIDGCDQQGCSDQRADPPSRPAAIGTVTSGHLSCGYCVADGMAFCPIHGWTA